MPTKVIIADQFERSVRKLKHDYPHILRDIQVLRTQLEADETPGDQIPGVGYTVFKVRVKSSDIRKGKSGGYRVLYYLKAKTCIYLVAIYLKSQQENFDKKTLRQLIASILGDADLPC